MCGIYLHHPSRMLLRARWYILFIFTPVRKLSTALRNKKNDDDERKENKSSQFWSCSYWSGTHKAYSAQNPHLSCVKTVTRHTAIKSKEWNGLTATLAFCHHLCQLGYVIITASLELLSDRQIIMPCFAYVKPTFLYAAEVDWSK